MYKLTALLRNGPRPVRRIVSGRCFGTMTSPLDEQLKQSSQTNETEVKPQLNLIYKTLPYTNDLRSIIDTTQHNIYLHNILKGMKVLFLCNHYNTLTQRVETELKEYDVTVTSQAVRGKKDILKAVSEIEHDIIVCPFLTRRIPEEVWANDQKPCLIVHPGITGDRGASSIDWALKMQAAEWGVTVMQAAEEMDAGDIWASKTFPIHQVTTTKTELYVGDVTDSAVETVLLALVRFKLGIEPIPLDYDNPQVKGTLMPLMKDKDRMIDWNSSAFDVAETIRMADTQPGGIGTLQGDDRPLRFFGAKYTENLMFNGKHIRNFMLDARPGDVLGHKDEAILVKCGDNNGVWISHLKCPSSDKPLKLPATSVFKGTDTLHDLSFLSSYREIWVDEIDNVAYVNFDFYNGAMSVTQCRKLKSVLDRLSFRPDITCVVLKGGFRFFSTGIHLNVIEGSDDPERESYDNIVAIDDVIRTVFSMKHKTTVSCLIGNAGAGGAMMAAATDFVFAHKGVVLTPTYKAMYLYGSEYWTYFLPQRVGYDTALSLTNDTKSMMASTAQRIGLVDQIIGRNRPEALGNLHDRVLNLLQSEKCQTKREEKRNRTHEWYQMLEEHRTEELSKMQKCFSSEDYHEARRKFVYH
ncbi:hydrogenase maturation factor HoxX-like [Tubulanus polymorphus]|uniref:hydrogenase maturation factor HoxX-like n=1 Tax=Tubulanus polymorphus TaxID=672921 RepID=UPI003DA1E877